MNEKVVAARRCAATAIIAMRARMQRPWPIMDGARALPDDCRAGSRSVKLAGWRAGGASGSLVAAPGRPGPLRCPSGCGRSGARLGAFRRHRLDRAGVTSSTTFLRDSMPMNSSSPPVTATGWSLCTSCASTAQARGRGHRRQFST